MPILLNCDSMSPKYRANTSSFSPSVMRGKVLHGVAFLASSTLLNITKLSPLIIVIRSFQILINIVIHRYIIHSKKYTFTIVFYLYLNFKIKYYSKRGGEIVRSFLQNDKLIILINFYVNEDETLSEQLAREELYKRQYEEK